MEKKIIFTVKGKTISEICPLHWSSNTVDYIKAGFVLDDEWKSCDVVRAAWSGRQGTIVTLLDADDSCVVPHEVLAVYGKVSVNLYGVKYDDDGEEFTRITTAPVTAIIIDSTARIDGSETAPVTPSQFDQYVEAVKSETEKVTGMTAVAETLPTGSDATASYSDGVLTLGLPRGVKGDTGATGPQGPVGPAGPKGEDGFSPVANVTKVGNTATITITDKNGTTTASISDGSGGGGGVTVDDALSSTSTNPVQNKVITNALNAKANTSSLASVATSGSYNDLSNKPTIPTVPTNVSAFTNDAGYITSVPSEYVTETELTTAIAGKANTADLATVATSGDYADLTNKPTIPTVPTNVSAFTNDAHYITASGAPVQSVNGQTGAVTVSVPTKTSDLTNDSGFVTDAAMQSALDQKVDKVAGKGLSTEDFTSAEKAKLAGIEAGAQVNTITGVKGDAEAAYRTGDVNITKANVGLGNVDNTSDLDKPISTATQTALANQKYFYIDSEDYGCINYDLFQTS